jgi:hypothetical protein
VLYFLADQSSASSLFLLSNDFTESAFLIGFECDQSFVAVAPLALPLVNVIAADYCDHGKPVCSGPNVGMRTSPSGPPASGLSYLFSFLASAPSM